MLSRIAFRVGWHRRQNGGYNERNYSIVFIMTKPSARVGSAYGEITLSTKYPS